MSSTIVGLIVVEASFLAVCLISYGLRTSNYLQRAP